MGEFRIGRKYASHVYPDTPRSLPAAFARNFAATQTPLAITTVATAITWTVLQAGVPPSATIPITPKVTGILRIIASILAQSTSAAVPASVTVNLVVDGGAPSLIIVDTVDNNIPGEGFAGAATMTVVIDITVPVGAHTVALQILDQANGLATMIAAFVDIQELPPASG
jgi:hypothetical protein